jgi:hypothetical protein
MQQKNTLSRISRWKNPVWPLFFIGCLLVLTGSHDFPSPPEQPQDYQDQEPQLKNVYIAIAGSGQPPREVMLAPGATPLDVLEQINLNGYRLQKPGGRIFSFEDDVFSAVDNYQKLYASPDDVEIG